MVIAMELKNVILRGKTYAFRMPVPKDCIHKIGRSEIVQSLKTTDPAEAAVAAKKLREVWIAKFKSARTRVLPVSVVEPVTIGNQQSELANVSYTYDALKRVDSEISAGVTNQYRYDLQGNRTQAVYGVTGRTNAWEYDALNRLLRELCGK